MRKKLAGRFQAAGIPDTDVRITYAGGSNDWDLYQQAKAGGSVERADWQNRFNTLLAAGGNRPPKPPSCANCAPCIRKP